MGWRRWFPRFAGRNPAHGASAPRAPGEANGRGTGNDTGAALDAALALLQSGDPVDGERALALLDPIASTASGPEARRALELSGQYLHSLGELDRAAQALGRAHALAPEDVPVNFRLATVQLALGEAEAALDHFTLALHYEPGLFAACEGRVQALKALGRAAEEEAAVAAFLARNPGHVPATCTLAGLRYAASDYDGAVALLEPLAQANPGDRDACNLLGLILGRELCQFDRSKALLAGVLATSPGWPPAMVNLAWMHFETGEHDQGVALIDQVLAVSPQDDEARLVKSYANLKRGRFAEGWRDYHARLTRPSARERPYRFPRWDGSAAPQARMLVYAEQGLGDHIMFASCFAQARAMVGSLTIECHPKLVALFTRSFPDCDVRPSVPFGEPARWLDEVPPFDLQAPMGDLPAYFRGDWASFPGHAGYLRADPARVAHWRERLDGLGAGSTFGLSWAGGAPGTRRHLRSLPPEAVLPLLRLDARFVSLQYGDCTADLAAIRELSGVALPHWPETIEDYDDTAALVCALDGVVSVCTAIVHLSGALGRPVWVLTPSVPEWRYLHEGERLPWYPSARLVRQVVPGDWAVPVAALLARLEERPGVATNGRE